MERTLETSPTEMSEKTQAQVNEVTPLFKSIENEEWDSVATFLETGSWGWKWSSLCAQLYQVSEKAASAQVRTWVTSAKKDGNGEISSLPIHAAVTRNAPLKVIQILHKTYSKGVRNPDSEGNYPLHLAFQKGTPLETLTFLMKEFPEAVHLKNKEEKLPAECGPAHGISELMNLCIGATKTKMESELNKEKGSLEEDRKQLLEVTKELMNLKKMVAERERNMTKDNFLYQKQHLNSAISQLTKLKTDLDKHEENVLKHHLVAEKKRMDGVLGELNKTKGELDKIKSEHQVPTAAGESAQPKPSPVATALANPQQKKKKPKKPKKVVTNRHAYPAEDDEMEREGVQETTSDQLKEGGSDPWSGREGLRIETDNINPGESRDANDGTYTPKSNGSQSPRKLKNVAARFKKKMNWRKSEKQAPEAE
ncbi:expressed unknown protein [Seminavis robusta]|uniref:Uncharacterized protein n=1 Tax=Seminavis robusta TaxID=568900 RepID=A0A9N8EMM8_9STRA|nr:expressed unknown protein [Seminavis robusta]|eukprot:Sro1226_g254230.1 n/a (424) ;mRNA; f:25041-26312